MQLEKEKENVRETKIIINSGDLEKEIPQDFEFIYYILKCSFYLLTFCIYESKAHICMFNKSLFNDMINEIKQKVYERNFVCKFN